MSTSPRHRRALRRPAAVTGTVAVLVVASIGALSFAFWRQAPSDAGGPSPSAAATIAQGASQAASATAAPTAPAPTASPTPGFVAATTDGVLLPNSQAALATRHPIAVMIDDQAFARPQSGLSQADIVYQAPAEGGIPRYMAIFQTQNPASVGPIRSSRFYFVGWAAEWQAVYAHVGGAPNALAYIAKLNRQHVWDADERKWGGANGYMFRIGARAAPHNCYTTAAKIEALAARLGATQPFAQAHWTFADAAPSSARPTGGTLRVPYPANKVSYQYDPTTNTYLRSVTGEGPQIDAGNHRRVAPSNVVVQYVQVGPLWNSGSDSSNETKGRLEIGYVGSGTASVFENGVAIAARWSKPSDFAPTVFTYASGPNVGKPITFVRGQIFVQVVPAGTSVTWTAGRS